MMAVTPTISARPVLVKPTCGHSFTGREFFKVTYFHPQVLVPSAGRWLSASIVRCFFIVGVGLPIGRALLVVGLYFYCTTKKKNPVLSHWILGKIFESGKTVADISSFQSYQSTHRSVSKLAIRLCVRESPSLLYHQKTVMGGKSRFPG